MKSFRLLAIALLAAFTLNAQNEKKSEIQVKILKDGKTVKDTTYMVEDAKAVDHASKILDMTFGEPKAGENYKVMTFISDDGEMHEFHSGDPNVMKKHKMHAEMGERHEMMKKIHKSDENTQVFVTTEEGEDGETMTIVKEIKTGKDGDIHKMMSAEGMNKEEHEMMMKMIHESDDDTQVFVTTEEGEDGETKVTVKKIKMGKDGDHSFSNEEENVFIMKGDKDGDLKHFEHNGEEPVWIEKDGGKVLIIDSDGTKKKIMVVTDSDSDYEFKTEEGETIIVKTTKDGKNEKEVNVEVIVKDEKATKANKKKKK